MFSSSTDFRWMDSGTHTNNPIEPLAFDEALATRMSQPGALPIIHLWVYDKGLYLGRRDAKLPQLETALRTLGHEGYGCVLRSSGGACVPLDAGVLNVAFLLPDTTISIDAFFRFVSSVLHVGLQTYGQIQFGEVIGSYCAGEYDFSIHGKKIGGMAQRRTRHGSILQLCINVEELSRGTLMERFYQMAGLNEMKKNKPIPYIDASTVGSIASLTNQPVTVSDVKECLYAAIGCNWKVERTAFSLPVDLFTEARYHLTEKLSLFAYQAREMQAPSWQLPR